MPALHRRSNHTTQTCSGCGLIVPKGLNVRWHSCPACGTELDRDENAAIVRRFGAYQISLAEG